MPYIQGLLEIRAKKDNPLLGAEPSASCDLNSGLLLAQIISRQLGIYQHSKTSLIK